MRSISSLRSGRALVVQPVVHPFSERRLAAILSADIAGYSLLMGRNEAATVRDLKAHQTVVLPMVGWFGGSVIDTAGDGVLAQFPSAVRAVECAVAIQQTMAERNRTVPEDRRMLFRIGVNLGDIILDRARIYGDGVNVAARLQALAEPGGVCISRDARSQVRDKVPYFIMHLGEHTVKNIVRPVRAFGLSSNVVAGLPKPPIGSQKRPWPWRFVAPIAGALLLLAVGTHMAWQQHLSVTHGDPPGAAKDGRLSVVVLPFTNLTDDAKWSRVAAGLTEDVITDLSHSKNLFGIASSSTDLYKGKPGDNPEVGRELGVKD